MPEMQALIWIENAVILSPQKKRQIKRRWNFLHNVYGCDPRIEARRKLEAECSAEVADECIVEHLTRELEGLERAAKILRIR